MRREFQSLQQSLPYIRSFAGKVFVLKLGGEVCDVPSAIRTVAQQIAIIQAVGMKCVLVHGGGAQATSLGERLGVPSEFVKGRRVTSPEMLQVMKMAVRGVVNTDVVSALVHESLPAVGLSGIDAALIQSKKRLPKEIEGKLIDFGAVGDIQSINPSVIQALLDAHFIPVIACLSGGASGEVFNINGDTVATQLAIALKAEKLIFLTAVDGVMRDLNDGTSLISHISVKEIKTLLADKVITGGMIPKLENCIEAVESGVRHAIIVNGFSDESLLAEIFTNEGSGTLIEA